MTLVLGLQNGSVLILTLENGLKPLSITSHHLKPILNVVISPCNRYIITSGEDSMIFVYRSQL